MGPAQKKPKTKKFKDGHDKERRRGPAGARASGAQTGARAPLALRPHGPFHKKRLCPLRNVVVICAGACVCVCVWMVVCVGDVVGN